MSCWREELPAGDEVMRSVEFEEEGLTGLQRFETKPTTLAASLQTALAAGSRRQSPEGGLESGEVNPERPIVHESATIS